MENDFLAIDKVFVWDKKYFFQENIHFVLDKKKFVWGEGWGIRIFLVRFYQTKCKPLFFYRY